MEAEPQFEWEYSKENVLPAKSGRKVQTLSSALSGALVARKRDPADVEAKIAYVSPFIRSKFLPYYTATYFFSNMIHIVTVHFMLQ